MANSQPITLHHSELPTPRLLQLPAELRVMIYRFLCNDRKSQVYAIPMAQEYRPGTRLFRLPILQVCRLIRHEAIPIWYGAHYLRILVLTGCLHRELYSSQVKRWISTVDLYALFSMKGIKIKHLPRRAKTWAGELNVRETTIIGLQGTLSHAVANYIGGFCRKKELFDTIRDACLREFGRQVMARPERFKEELLQLVELFNYLDCFCTSFFGLPMLERWAHIARSGGPLLHPYFFGGSRFDL